MIRTMVKIDKEKCNGCGLCITACHEGAIELVDGKAQLIRDDYCDGLGNCLPACPTDAISFEDREAAPYDQAAVDQHLEKLKQKHGHAGQNDNQQQPFGHGNSKDSHSDSAATSRKDQLPCGCPGSMARELTPAPQNASRHKDSPVAEHSHPAPAPASQLRQWPVQIKLAPVNAPYFKDAHLLIAADCTAFSYGDFHNTFMKNKVTLIGCPKLDEGDYAEKLTAILRENDIKSVSVVRMEVPCCAGIANAVVEALKNCGKMIPWQVHILSTTGEILEA